MPYNHLDARALNSPGGPIDALTATIRDATQASLRMRDRSEERGMRRQLLEMQQRQRGEDIRRALAVQGVDSVDELAKVSRLRRQLADEAAQFDLTRKKKKAGTEDIIDEDRIAAIGRADFDRAMAQALASGIGLPEYDAPEEVPGGIGPIAPTTERSGVLRSMLKYDGSRERDLINAAAERGAQDRDLAVRKKEADIAADEARREYYANRETATKGPMTADQAQDAARKAAFDDMGITGMGDLAYEIVEEPVLDSKGRVVNGLDGRPMVKEVKRSVSMAERQKRAAAFRPLYIQQLNRRGFNEDGTPYVAPPVEVPPNPSDVVGFDIPELLRMRREERESTPIDLAQAYGPLVTPSGAPVQQPPAASAAPAPQRQRPPGAMVSPQELADYAAKHGISVAAARANLAAAGYKVQ